LIKFWIQIHLFRQPESILEMVNGYIVKIIRCRNIPAKHADGFSDPYVKLKLDGHGKQKTKVIKKNLNPEFNQEFKYPNWSKSENLVISVWDHGRLAKNMFIGQVIFHHPEQGVISGVFPLLDQNGQPVGGTMEVNITSEYLIGVERRRSSTDGRRSSIEGRRSSGSGIGEHGLEHKKEASPVSSESDHSITRSGTDHPVFIHGLDDARRAALTFPMPEDDREKEIEKEKERLEQEKENLQKEKERLEREKLENENLKRLEKEEKEKERILHLEKEREEDRMRLEQAMKRVDELESENKKQGATIESLEKEVTDLRQTVTSLEAWSNEGKAHTKGEAQQSWFHRLFACCSSNKSASKLEEPVEMTNDPVSHTRGSV